MKRWWWVALLAIAAIIALLLWRRGRDTSPEHEPASGGGSAHGTLASGVQGTGSGPRAALMPAWAASRGLPGKRIAGIVTFEGARVAGATVRMTSWFPESPEVVRTTDAAGAFDFGVWTPPGYMIAANAPGRVGVSQWVELRDPTVKPPSDALELKLLGCAATLSGNVLDSSGGPIEKARVVFGSTRVETDRTGAYRTCAVRGGSTLRVSADGYGGVHLFIGINGDASRDIVLIPEITVVGRVIRGIDGVAVPDAVVTISPVGAWSPDGPNPVTAVTDATGRFRADGIPPGPLTATAIADDLTAEPQVKATALVGQTPPDLTIRMIGTVRIRGKVVGAGKPIAGAKVVAVRKSPLAYSRDAITQTDGSFALDHVFPGELAFKVTPYEVVSPASLVVTADRDGVVVDVASLGVISGRTLRNKVPIPRVEVRVIGGGGNTVVTSDDRGHYEVTGLAAGTIKLFPTAKEAEAFGNVTEVVLAAAERKDNVDLDVPYGATIDGKVIDQDNKPVANVYVRFMQPNGDLGESETGADGSFHCHSMTGGAPYHPEVFPTRALQRAFPWVTPARDVMLEDGTSHVEGVVLAVTIVRLGIRGRVVDGSGAAVADARVRAQPMTKQGAPTFASWLRLPSAVADATGGFVIPDLPEDEYALQAVAPDGSEGTLTPVRAGATSATIVVQRSAGIDGKLVGFGETPVVYAQSRKDTSRFVSAQLDGASFTFRGLAPGPYVLTAQSTNEGGALHVDLEAGAIQKVTITSHGRGSITATLVPFNGVGGAPSGFVCHVVARAGDESGITNWDPSTSPKSDAQGRVTFEPAPAGDVFVQCNHPASTWSDGQVAATLATGGQATVRILVVKNLLPSNAANIGSIGVDLTWARPGLVENVQRGSEAERLGIVAGDLIVSIDGSPVAGLTTGGILQLIINHPIGSTIKLGVSHAGTIRVVTLAVTPPR
jgi:hypothetical protein